MIRRRYTFHRLITGLFLLPVIITATILDSVSYAVPDIVFYAQNDITRYDPTACNNSASGDSSLPNVGNATSPNAVAETVFKFLTGKKFSGLGDKPFNAIQAAGALGNFELESRMDPGNIEKANGEGHGLAQWSFGRKEALFKLASDKGKKWSDLDVQLLMIEKEINASYGKALLNEGFGNIKTPSEGSFIFEKIYEVALKATAHQAERNKAAEDYYKLYKDLAPDAAAGTTTSGSACGGAAATTEFSADGFKVYDQCDTRWAEVAYGSKTACSSGCGPTSMAAAITALTGKAVTPKETVAYASSKGMYREGEGSLHTLPVVIGNNPEWSIGVKKIGKSIEEINNVLRADGLVIVAAPLNKPAPFTTGGHYILIRGVTASGKWKIADSNFAGGGEANSKKEWDARALLNSVSETSIYALTK
jgi:hypothetical protein